MQEFYKQPIVERIGFMEMLRVGSNYYTYKNRQLAGIPIRVCDCAANDRAALLMGRYVILRNQPSTVYSIDGECGKGNRRVLKLKNMGWDGTKGDKVIPSSWMPRNKKFGI